MRQKLHYRLVVLNRVVTRLIALTPIPRWVVSLKRPEIRGPFSTELTSNNNWLSILLTRTGSQEEFVSVVFGKRSIKLFNRLIKWEPDGEAFWRSDYFRGLTCRKNSYLSNLKKYSSSIQADPVCLWELSRLSLAMPLAACSTERIGKGDITLDALLKSWIRNNPFPRGLIWSVPLESSIRALALLPVVMWHSGESKQLATDTVWLCIHHLLNTTIRGKTPKNNHRLVELTLLAIMLPLYPKLTERNYGKVIGDMLSEYDKQFYTDGHNIEGSTGYHAFTLEVLLLFIFAFQHSPTIKQLSSKFINQIEDLATLAENGLYIVSLYSECFGRSPNFGDSSDSRLLIGFDYYSRDLSDHTYLAKIFHSVIKNPLPSTLNELIFKIFPRSGYGYFKNKRYGVCVNAAKTNEVSGHAHNDKCSWVMQIEGKQFFVDPGTWMYNCLSEDRIYFRSSNSHNVLTVDKQEQSTRELASQFSCLIDIETSICKQGNSAMQMRHNGFARLESVQSHERTLEFSDDRIVVTDVVEGLGVHTIHIGYLLHPDVEVTVADNEVYLVNGESECCILFPKEGKIKITPSKYSRYYGEVTSSVRIEFILREVSLPRECKYTIRMV